MSDSESENASKMPKTHSITETLQKTISNRHQRTRYWTSYEELRLVELWRRHFNEIKVYDKNEPIHRIIAEGMKERQLNLNAQECRRKINVLRNKYFAERKRLTTQPAAACSKSDWYLYSYIDCIYNPLQPNPELRHELDTLARIHDIMAIKRPTMRSFQPSQAYKRIKSEHASDSFPFLMTSPNSELSDSIKPIKKRKTMVTEQRLPLRQHTPKTQKPPQQVPEPVIIAETTNVILTATNTTEPPPAAAPGATAISPTIAAASARRSRRLLPKRGHITLEHIERLRVENQQLSIQRDQQLKQLELEEQEVVQLECYFNQWQSQQEQLMQLLIQRAVSD